jgi:hypothetical protein
MVLSNQQKGVAYESCNLCICRQSATAGSSSSPTTSNSQKLKKAYDVFKHVGESHALKVIIENDISE